MADTYYRWTNGAGTRVWSTLANWIDLETGAAPANVPGNSDTVIFDSGADSPNSGNTGLSLTGLNVTVTPNCTQDIVIGTTSFGSVRHDGGNITLTGDITSGKFRCRRGTKFTHVSGTQTLMYAEADVTIQGGAVLTTGRVKGRYHVDIAANATAITGLHLKNGAMATTYRSGLFEVGRGATVRTLGAATIATGSVVHESGRIQHTTSQDLAGSVEVEPGGYLDFGECHSVVDVDTLIEWPEARINKFTRAGEITISNVHNIVGFETGGVQTGEGAVPL